MSLPAVPALLAFFALLLITAAPAVAQLRPPGPIVGAGYAVPQPIKVAPGQIITLFVHSDGTQPPHSAGAAQLPLPVTLSGYSVRLEQTFQPTPLPIPLFAVYPVDNCYGLFPSVCSDLTAITVQIPWELVPNVPKAGRPSNFAVLKVSLEGASGEAFPLQPEPDSIHILSSCDSTLPRGTERAEDLTGPCKPLVTHMNGRLVTPANPAAPGDVLLLYAVGLGQSEGEVHTGEGVSAPVPLTDVFINFEYGANLVANRRPTGPATPISVSLTPGEVGLYQVAFTVPPLAARTPACTASTVSSNLTVSIARLTSFDGVGICVARAN